MYAAGHSSKPASNSASRDDKSGQTSEDESARPSPPHDEDAGGPEYSGPLPYTADQVREALLKALKSPEFQSAPQLRSFLDFVVNATLSNERDKIKGYTIAVEALRRGTDFNPVTDPIVRVEAARLRRRLDDYYAGSGGSDFIRIAIPKGSYAPEFQIAQTGPVHKDAGHKGSGQNEREIGFVLSGKARLPGALGTAAASPGGDAPLALSPADTTGSNALPRAGTTANMPLAPVDSPRKKENSRALSGRRISLPQAAAACLLCLLLGYLAGRF